MHDTHNAKITTIKAAQELIHKMERLEAENQQLKTKNTSMESTLLSIQEQLGEIKALLNVPGAKTTANRKIRFRLVMIYFNIVP